MLHYVGVVCYVILVGLKGRQTGGNIGSRDEVQEVLEGG